MWRQQLYQTVPGVTYSAYGEGEKPLFNNSPENGADPGKWELYHQGDDGRKIWKFYQDMDTVGGIYLNGTELEAGRVYGYWVGDHYVDLAYSYDPAPDPDNASGWTLHVGGEQRPETSLEDLEFCCMPDLTGRDYPIDMLGDKSPGPLYLRCDAGNPGEVFDSIEFCGSYWPIAVSSDCVFDNLAIRYWSVFAFWGHPDTDKNVVIQNCEVAYGRQNTVGFHQPEPDCGVINDAIYGVAQNAVIRHNYIHDNDGSGITFETSPDSRPQSADDGPVAGLSFTCTGNLIERCGACIQLNDGNDWFDFDRITISDNIAADAGCNHGTDSMGVNSFCPFADLVLGSWGRLAAKTLEVSGNVFLRSRRYILTCGYDSVYQTDNDVLFHDNVYIQVEDRLFGPNCYGDWFVCSASDQLCRTSCRNTPRARMRRSSSCRWTRPGTAGLLHDMTRLTARDRPQKKNAARICGPRFSLDSADGHRHGPGLAVDVHGDGGGLAAFAHQGDGDLVPLRRRNGHDALIGAAPLGDGCHVGGIPADLELGEGLSLAAGEAGGGVVMVRIAELPEDLHVGDGRRGRRGRRGRLGGDGRGRDHRSFRFILHSGALAVGLHILPHAGGDHKDRCDDHRQQQDAADERLQVDRLHGGAGGLGAGHGAVSLRGGAAHLPDLLRAAVRAAAPIGRELPVAAAASGVGDQAHLDHTFL